MRLVVVALTTALTSCAARLSTGVESTSSQQPEAPAAATPAPGAGTVWAGAYTEAQAERGWNTYVEQCSECHSETMFGGPGAPGVAGPEFLFGWDGTTVGDLFEYTRASMPPDYAGSLSDREYVDVLAVILRGNDFPASRDTELVSDVETLSRIRITRER